MSGVDDKGEGGTTMSMVKDMKKKATVGWRRDALKPGEVKKRTRSELNEPIYSNSLSKKW